MSTKNLYLTLSASSIQAKKDSAKDPKQAKRVVIDVKCPDGSTAGGMLQGASKAAPKKVNAKRKDGTAFVFSVVTPGQIHANGLSNFDEVVGLLMDGKKILLDVDSVENGVAAVEGADFI